MVATFHADLRYGGAPVGKILEIGRPWVRHSTCDHILVSLPYTIGPEFEYVSREPPFRIAWLLPITSAEAAFGRANGIEALEQAFEEAAIDTLDSRRASVV
ncbi:MAG: suppressor of fused domain protein [Kofleriaceae bacterium]